MLARWTEFIDVHILYPLNFSVFLSLLQKLVKAFQNNSVTQEEVNEYLECNMLQIVVLNDDICLTIKTWCITGINYTTLTSKVVMFCYLHQVEEVHFQ